MTIRVSPPARPAAIIATYLLTGVRESEVYRLEVRNVSLERGTVVFRPRIGAV